MLTAIVRSPVGRLDLLHMRGGAGDARIVDEDIDAAHRRHGGLEQPVDLSRIPDVGHGGADALSLHVLDQTGLDVAGEHRRSVGCQGLRNDAPNARAAGGDHRTPPFTGNLHAPLPLLKRAQE